MHNFGKLALTLGIGMLSLLSVKPVAAQIDTRVVFTAPFPFYAGNVKWPAGTYVITEPNQNTWTVLMRNIAGTKGGFISLIPTSSVDPQKETDVTFHKYGDTGYLQTLSVEGEVEAIAFPRSKAEAKAAETMTASTNENTIVVERAMVVGGK